VGKSEFRIPKSEINPKSEKTGRTQDHALDNAAALRNSDFNQPRLFSERLSLPDFVALYRR
jgi:hypothetical protein